MADVTEMLERDHRRAEQLFEMIKVTTGAARITLVEDLGAVLRLHMDVEESIVYPVLSQGVDGGDVIVEDSITEHRRARRDLAKMEELSPDKPGFDAALEMLEASIARHVVEEEEDVFPEFRASVHAADLDQLGERLAAAKSAAAMAAT